MFGLQLKSKNEIEKQLKDFFSDIKSDVQKMIVGKKYFNFIDHCTLQLEEYYNSGNEESKVPFSLNDIFPSPGYACSKYFDEHYDSHSESLIDGIMQYCNFYNFVLLAIEIDVYLSDVCPLHDDTDFIPLHDFIDASDSDSDSDSCINRIWYGILKNFKSHLKWKL
mgnify:CR=1 FL=1